jgi:hypothetical protein
MSQFNTIEQISDQSLIDFHNELNILKTSDTHLNKNFENPVLGYKTSDTVNVDLPLNYLVHQGPIISSYDAIIERVFPVVISQDRNTNLSMSLLDKTLNARDYEHYVKPMAMNHANFAENWFGTLVGQSINFFVGTAGAKIASLEPLAQARALSSLLGIPSPMFCCLEENNYSTLIQSPILSNNFDMPMSKSINRYYSAGNFYNFDTYHSINAYRHIAGIGDSTQAPSAGFVPAGTVGAYVDNGNIITIKGLGATDAGTFLKGDKITISGVYSVNPKNLQSTGKLMQFCITQDALQCVGGVTTITVSPSIVSDLVNTVPIPSPYKNVTNPISVDSVVTLVSANQGVGSSTKVSYGVSFVYNPQALIFVCPPLVEPRIPKEMYGRSIDPDTNISLLMTDFYIQEQRMNTTRMDMIFGGYVYAPLVIAILGY